MPDKKLKVAFVHPDLGIGGAERLVVDAALGLQKLGHSVVIYTSHHDPSHCFEETRDGTLRVVNVKPPFPRSFKGKLHIVFAHLRQLHLMLYLLLAEASAYDVFFVDQLSTCVPFIRSFAGKRVVFYCHFPDKLLADGQFEGIHAKRPRSGFLKKLYRLPMDILEEKTTAQADILLANSKFTSTVFQTFFSIPRTPLIVYPGINIHAYEAPSSEDLRDSDIVNIYSQRPTFLSLNRFEKKKNAALAVKAFALLRKKGSEFAQHRLILAGGYDPRLRDNQETLEQLIDASRIEGLSYWLTTPSGRTLPKEYESSAKNSDSADVVFLLNFSTMQRSALLTAPSTLALLYTPANEHFGIGPVEGMICGLPVLACDSGGPTESIVIDPPEERTGWLSAPDEFLWAETMQVISELSQKERQELSNRARMRAESLFSMEAMSRGIEQALYDAVNLGEMKSSPYIPQIRDAFVMLLVSILAYFVYRFIS